MPVSIGSIATVNLSPFGKQQLVDFPIFKGLAFQHSAHYSLLMCLARGAWKSQSLDGIDEIIETAVIIKKEVREERTSCNAADHDASKSCKTLLSTVKADRTLLCERESLTSNPNDLVLLCEPTCEERREPSMNDCAEMRSRT